MINIVLCGGSGTRLWPISRKLMPKQFVKLFNNRSLFQLTVQRNSKICDTQIIVSNQEQYFLAYDQLEQLNILNSQYLLEPIGKNTAPAIALTCFGLDPDDVVLVTPSDHLIKDENEYKKVLQKAEGFANQDFLVTFGIIPTYIETGFGYIEAENGYDVKGFHEKPELRAVVNYLETGNFYWNSGMFCFKAGVFLEELKKYSPEIYKTSLKAYKNSNNEELCRIKQEDMEKIPSNSIDYAVMEHSLKVKVVPSDIQWSDVGSFDSLSKELPNDENSNLVLTQGKAVELIDVKNLIIVDTEDALLICKKGSSQKVRQIHKKIIEENKELVHVHKTVYRPWGTYTVLEDTLGYKIKRIEVKPGKRLSLQKHFYRNEHWIVIDGTATVTVGNEKKLVKPNESTYIKMGEKHRLENKGKIPVILIEAQVGEYTGEDDIVRFEDDFKRK